jgi:hypothetical protein
LTEWHPNRWPPMTASFVSISANAPMKDGLARTRRIEVKRAGNGRCLDHYDLVVYEPGASRLS